ncbi:MAG: hypothetical protein QME88_06755 [Actinomycetota bacterium]|nr:hypothetical protein [Actinomycetota bacterium]
MGAVPLTLAAAGMLRTLSGLRHRERFLPLFCLLIPLLILSLIPSKPPWLIASILPYGAILAGWGSDGFISMIQSRARGMRFLVVGSLVLALVVPALPFSYQGYIRSRQRTIYEFSLQMKVEAMEARDLIGSGSGVIAFFGRGNVPQAVFIHYLLPDSIFFLSGDEEPSEVPNILRENGMEAAVLWMDDLGIEYAQALASAAGMRFTATRSFLVGRLY